MKHQSSFQRVQGSRQAESFPKTTEEEVIVAVQRRFQALGLPVQRKAADLLECSKFKPHGRHALGIRRGLHLLSVPAAAVLLSVRIGAASFYFISPSGTPSGDGSITRPWDIGTGFSNQVATVEAGDTVYLRAGTCVSSAAANGQIAISYRGQPGNPVIVRAYPGERATIDARNFAYQQNILPGARGAMNFICWINGQFCRVMDLEFTESSIQSRNSYSRINGVFLNAPGAGVINCVVHNVDVGILPMPGTAPWIVYGNIVNNNGWYGTGAGTPGHGIYAQNNSTRQIAHLEPSACPLGGWGQL